MISIIRNENAPQDREYSLFINGKQVKDVLVQFQGGNPGEGGVYNLKSLNLDTFILLTKYTFNDFPDYKGGSGYTFPLHRIDYKPAIGEIGLITSVTIFSEEIVFRLKPNLTEWNRPYSFLDYGREFTRVGKNEYQLDVHFYEYDISAERDDSFWVRFEYPSSREELKGHVLSVIFLIQAVHQQTEENLIPNVKEKSVVASFPDFPKEVETYCEQYLTYFIQFLRDLGVDATSELKHEAGQVLFTVTPNNKHEALDNIRTALEIYLHLPSNPIGNDTNSEIAIQRLESQVLRFQSDLKLAAAELQAKNATIESKEATIEAQQLTINVQKALLHGEIFPPPMKQIGHEQKADKEEDREEFFGGTVALGVYKDKGFEVSWARMFRHLRDLFENEDKDEKPPD